MLVLRDTLIYAISHQLRTEFLFIFGKWGYTMIYNQRKKGSIMYNKIRDFQKTYFLSFIFIELLLYICFLYLDFYRPDIQMLSNIVKFTSILLCFISAVVLSFPVTQKSPYVLYVIAIFCTLLADFFLLFTVHYPIGIFIFCIVQLLYHFYLFGSNKLAQYLIIPSLGTVIVLLFLNVSPMWVTYLQANVAVVVPACFYILLLLINIVTCVFSKRVKGKQRFLLLLGFLLLFVCDLQVGYSNIYDTLDVANHSLLRKLYEISCLGMWIFYLPSQILLISNLNSNIKQRNFIK